MELHKEKKLIVFDLDGTLTESKSPMTKEMSALLHTLLKKKLVAVIGGGSFEQFNRQFLGSISFFDVLLANLFLFPTSGARFYRYIDNEWSLTYANDLEAVEKQKIVNAFESAFKDISYKRPDKVLGDIFEDRDTQITFSALGQRANLEDKERWNKFFDVRLEIQKVLEKYIPEFEVRLGGLTSIDVTRKGIDKAYGIRQIEKILNIPKTNMLFIGDSLYEGGNDYPVRSEGVEAISVKGPKDTEVLIRSLLA